MTQLERQDLVYPELCYQIVGVLFSVWTDMGHGYKEKAYQNAIEMALRSAGLKYRRELPVRLRYRGKKIAMM